MLNRSKLPLVLPVLCALTFTAAPQNPTPPPRDVTRAAQTTPARIRGRVVAAESGQPLGRALVTLSGPSTDFRRTLTDPDGRYEFAELKAGRYSIGASKTGYVNLQYGQRRPFEPGRPVTVTDGQTLDRIDLSLPRGAVIVARVTDDLGFPVAGVEVRAQRFQYRADGQRVLSAIFQQGPSATDDRGEIRLFGLMPGEYVVGAVARFVSGPATAGPPGDGYAPTFYPGVISASQATPVSLRVGEESAVQFSLVRSRLSRVSGVVVDADGRPANGAQVMLGADTPGLYPGSGGVGPDGRFAIGDVPPGEYAVHVTYNALEEIASMLSVNGVDVTDLRIVARPGATVSGRVVFEGGAPPTGNPSPVRIVLAPATSVAAPGFMKSGRTAPHDADGRFWFTGVTGRVLVDVTAPEGWAMKSVTVAGDDVTNDPLDVGERETLSNLVIRVTNRLTTLSGQVTDTGGQMARDYVVVVVPADAYVPSIMARRVRAVRSGPEGTFTTRGLMPGRYLAVAVNALEEGRQFSPEFQQQVRRLGHEFTLREGETGTVNLRLTPGL